MKRHGCILQVFEDLYGPLDGRVKILESNGTRIKALAKRILEYCNLGNCDSATELLKEINSD
jgi:hypothetical protein